MAQLRVGIDSYCLNPLRMDPFAILEWVEEQGGEGVQFSEVHLPPGREMDEGILGELAGAARNAGMYLEWGGGQHIPYDTATWKPKDLMPVNRRAAEEASVLGAAMIRSCSGGFFRWSDEAPSTEELLSATASALRPQRPIFQDLGVTLALELHFEFTTFELLRLFEMCGAEPGGWLGICLDTFNMLPMLEDPGLGTERALPWVVSTHVKDGGVALDGDGLLTFPTAAGEGSVDLPSIFSLLRTLERPVNLSVEDHGGSFSTPFTDEGFLSRFPDLTVKELSRLVSAGLQGTERMERGEMTVTSREDWPTLCQERTSRGLRNVRRLARETAAGAPRPSEGTDS
jgi:sugar phosphate isomerase/epimerase